MSDPPPEVAVTPEVTVTVSNSQNGQVFPAVAMPSEFKPEKMHWTKWHTLCGFVLASVLHGVCLQELHAHSKELRPLHRGYEVPILQTLVNLITLLVVTGFVYPNRLMNHSEGLAVTLIAHVSADYLFNFWYIYSRNDSFALGYFEPLVLVFVYRTCTKGDVKVKVVASLVAIAFICGLTSGDFGMLLNTNRNGIIIFLVVYFISLRNLGLKLLQEESVHLCIRKRLCAPYSCSVLVFSVIIAAIHLTYWALPLMFAIIAMFASVAMFYLTSELLESFTLITVSVWGMIAQLCVNLVCVPVEHTHNVFISLVAMVLLLGMLIVYFRYVLDMGTTDSLPQGESNEIPLNRGRNGYTVPHHEMFTRMEFLIFLGCFGGLLFYVFRPKLSKRDLNNLHYVGLDSFVKRILGHK